MANKTKTGRRGSEIDRQYAADIAAYYRECLENGAFSDAGHIYIDENGNTHEHRVSPYILLRAMDNFAKHGTFIPQNHADTKFITARLITQGCKTYEEKIQRVMERFSCSESTAARILSPKGLTSVVFESAKDRKKRLSNGDTD